MELSATTLPDSPATMKEMVGDLHQENIVLRAHHDNKIHVPAHDRKKGGKKSLPEDLLWIEVIHDINDTAFWAKTTSNTR